MNKYQKALRKIGDYKTVEGLKNNPNGSFKLIFSKPIKKDADFKESYMILQELVNIVPKYMELKDKATPKKPIGYVKIFGNYISTCPTCTCGVFRKDDVDNPIMYKGNYCTNCGQALDWSEEDE